MIEKEPEFTCCICKKHVKGKGHPAWPYAKGTCCDQCYEEKVLPERQIQIMNIERGKNNGRNS